MKLENFNLSDQEKLTVHEENAVFTALNELQLAFVGGGIGNVDLA